jgi:hypothetical protein
MTRLQRQKSISQQPHHLMRLLRMSLEHLDQLKSF